MSETLQRAAMENKIREAFKAFRISIGKPAEESPAVEQPSLTYSHFRAGVVAMSFILGQAALDILTAIELGTHNEDLARMCEVIRAGLCPTAGEEVEQWKGVRVGSVEGTGSSDSGEESEGSDEVDGTTNDIDIFS